MLEGITILNQTPIMEDPWWIIPLGCISFALLFPFVILFVCSICDGYNIAAGIFGSLTIVLLISLCISIKTADTVDTGRYRYEVTIDDAVPFNGLYEKYEVVTHNGKIWTIEDKEME